MKINLRLWVVWAASGSSLFFYLSSSAIRAEEILISGHNKYQFTYSQFDSDSIQKQTAASRHSDQHEVDLRVNLHGYLTVPARLRFELDGQVLGRSGKTVATNRKLSELSGIFATRSVEDDLRYFDLTKTVIRENDHFLTTRIDRLNLSYTSDSFVIKLGRQAISWGNGLLYQAMDLFNPFSPTAIDTDYKSGDDMLYSQVLLSSGADFQLMAVPRREPSSGDVRHTQSSYALKYHTSIEAAELDIDILTARHFNDTIYGLGLVRNLMGATLRSDIVATRLDDETTHMSIVGNIDRSWSVSEMNVRGFIEYFHSGFGEQSDLTRLNPALLEKLGRGELFSVSQNSLAIGGQIELRPWHNIYLTHIGNLHDSSGIFQYRSEIDLDQNLILLIGCNLPHGGSGTEFGGLPVPETDLTLHPPASAYLRLNFYF